MRILVPRVVLTITIDSSFPAKRPLSPQIRLRVLSTPLTRLTELKRPVDSYKRRLGVISPINLPM
jgi:hypothetical protein